jgi:hypothetical protein
LGKENIRVGGGWKLRIEGTSWRSTGKWMNGRRKIKKYGIAVLCYFHSHTLQKTITTKKVLFVAFERVKAVG